MVERIEHAFEANLSALAWMDEPTKAAARAKLRKIANLIGYPATWRDYSGLAIDRHTPLANYLAGVAYESKRQLAKIGKPVDRTEMPSSAQTVDASYSASLNTMSFPAGILQRPFFAPDAPAAANYSGIGFVIGHELTHGFDDQGSRYDGDGNVRNWWSATAGAAYAQKAACVRSQYSGYAVGDVHLDGGATLGENIADNGGLKLALAAFEADRRGRPAQSYAGFSEEQQFFIAFAQAWCTNVRPEAARIQAQTDVHSARRWRVDGSVANLPAFAAAFECKAGAPLAPASRCEVW
jgi:predicted metalloendopeptidase